MDSDITSSTTKLGQVNNDLDSITSTPDEHATESLGSTAVVTSLASMNTLPPPTTKAGGKNVEQSTTTAYFQDTAESVPLGADAAAETKALCSSSAVPASRLTVILATDKCAPGRERDSDDPEVSQMSNEVTTLPLSQPL